MKKHHYFCFAALLFLLLVISCSGSATTSELITLDASNLNANWINVKSGSQITLSNMDETKMYAIKTQGGDYKCNTKGAISTSGVFKTDDSTFVPIPDETNKSEFTANDVEIQGSGSIQIVEIKPGTDDMTIDTANDPVTYYDADGIRCYEEYYHIDFNDEPYNTLDKSRIVLKSILTGSASRCSTNWGYVTIGAGGIKPDGYTPGIYDLSNYSSINLYNFISIDRGTPTLKMQICNPTPCTVDQPITISNEHETFSFVPNANCNYVVEISKNNTTYYSDTNSLNLRLIDGTAIPYAYTTRDDEEKQIAYIGKLQKEIFFDLTLHNWGGDVDPGLGEVVVREATAEETEDFLAHQLTVTGSGLVFERSFISPSEESFFLNGSMEDLTNLEVIFECFDENGNYSGSYSYVYLNSLHTYEVGGGGVMLHGPYNRIEYGSTDILSLFSYSVPANVRIRITIRKNQTPNDGYWFDKSLLFIVKNDGTPVIEKDWVWGEEYVIPTLTRPGYTFEGFQCIGFYNGYGGFHAPGEKIIIEGRVVLLAIWSEN